MSGGAEGIVSGQGSVVGVCDSAYTVKVLYMCDILGAVTFAVAMPFEMKMVKFASRCRVSLGAWICGCSRFGLHCEILIHVRFSWCGNVYFAVTMPFGMTIDKFASRCRSPKTAVTMELRAQVRRANSKEGEVVRMRFVTCTKLWAF